MISPVYVWSSTITRFICNVVAAQCARCEGGCCLRDGGDLRLAISDAAKVTGIHAARSMALASVSRPSAAGMTREERCRKDMSNSQDEERCARPFKRNPRQFSNFLGNAALRAKAASDSRK